MTFDNMAFRSLVYNTSSLSTFAFFSLSPLSVCLRPSTHVAAFFLLACVKVKDSKDMENFFSGKERRGDSESGNDVVGR